jgi:rfaE bifunctional protein nucleotidyltransferase chain/domain
MSTTPNNSRFRAVALLDRDGNINEEVEYLRDPADFRLLPGAARAIRLLNQEGVAAIVTTNQSGIARGYLSEADLAAVHARMVAELAAEGARLDAIYYAPFLAESNSPMRKPADGMYRQAVADLGLEGLPVFSIGDRILDVEFGINCGGKGIRVLTGHQLKEDVPLDLAKFHAARNRGLTHTAENLLEAVYLLLAELAAEGPEDRQFSRKFASLHQTARTVASEKARDNRVVLATGFFDLLHGGHISYLEDSRAMGECLVLAVHSGRSIARVKGPGRPLLPEADRLRVLAALQCVDYLTLIHGDTADEALEVLRPDIHTRGTGYTLESVPERETARRLGIETRIAGRPKENSTRAIIETVVQRARAGLL